MKFEWSEWKGQIKRAYYGNGRTALQFWNEEDGPIATITTNLPEQVLADDEILIKSYSENEGMLEALVAQGIVSKPVKWVQSGFVAVPVVKLLKETF